MRENFFLLIYKSNLYGIKTFYSSQMKLTVKFNDSRASLAENYF